MRFCDVWIEQCEAAKQIEAEFGTQKALDYLIGEKFLNFLQAAETDAEFRAEIPAFVAESRRSSSPGNWPSTWRWLVSPSHWIRASINLWMTKRQRKSTPKTSKICARMTFGVRLMICSWWSRQELGFLGMGISPKTVPWQFVHNHGNRLLPVRSRRQEHVERIVTCRWSALPVESECSPGSSTYSRWSSSIG